MKRKMGLIAALLMAAAVLTACNESKFNGNRTGNESQFVMEYSIFNSTDSQVLKLGEGDVIDAEVVTNSGSVSVTIAKEGEEPVYENEAVATGTFHVEVPESGEYKITVVGKNAKGSVSFVKVAGDTEDIEAGERPHVIYVMDNSEGNFDGMPLPYISLDKEAGTFVFSYDALSSYLPYGKYEIDYDVLKAVTDDGLYTYVFEVVDDNTLKFRQEGSSEIKLIDENMEAPAVWDGLVFKAK